MSTAIALQSEKNFISELDFDLPLDVIIQNRFWGIGASKTSSVFVETDKNSEQMLIEAFQKESFRNMAFWDNEEDSFWDNY